MNKEEVDKLKAANIKTAEVWNILYDVIATLSENEEKTEETLESAQLHISGCQRKIEKVLYER